MEALVLLDMSAAFDTIDHGIMLYVLQQSFDINDGALDWFASYFVEGTQVVIMRTDSSFAIDLRIDAPLIGPRWDLGPVAYAENITDDFEQHRVRHCTLSVC